MYSSLELVRVLAILWAGNGIFVSAKRLECSMKCVVKLLILLKLLVFHLHLLYGYSFGVDAFSVSAKNAEFSLKWVVIISFVEIIGIRFM